MPAGQPSLENGKIWLSDDDSAPRSFELSDDTCKAIDAECSKDTECCYSCCEKGLGKKTGKCTDGDMCHMGRIIIWIIFIQLAKVAAVIGIIVLIIWLICHFCSSKKSKKEDAAPGLLANN